MAKKISKENLENISGGVKIVEDDDGWFVILVTPEESFKINDPNYWDGEPRIIDQIEYRPICAFRTQKEAEQYVTEIFGGIS